MRFLSYVALQCEFAIHQVFFLIVEQIIFLHQQQYWSIFKVIAWLLAVIHFCKALSLDSEFSFH